MDVAGADRLLFRAASRQHRKRRLRRGGGAGGGGLCLAGQSQRQGRGSLAFDALGGPAHVVEDEQPHAVVALAGGGGARSAAAVSASSGHGGGCGRSERGVFVAHRRFELLLHTGLERRVLRTAPSTGCRAGSARGFHWQCPESGGAEPGAACLSHGGMVERTCLPGVAPFPPGRDGKNL